MYSVQFLGGDEKFNLLVAVVGRVIFSVCHAKDMGVRNESILRYYTNIYRSNLDTLRKEIENAKTREDALKLVERAKSRVRKAT